MKHRKLKLKPKNVDIKLVKAESTNSEILDEIENTLNMGQSSSDESQDNLKLPIQLPHQQESESQYQSEEITEQDYATNEKAIGDDTTKSQKPARVVFRKSSKAISREERANQMAHFEYVESGINNTQDNIRTRRTKGKVDPKFYNSMHRKPARRAAHSENKNIGVEGLQPPTTQKFSPKRFRRFPRFTIFLNKEQENVYEKENSISLNPQFLNFLMTPERAEIVDKGKDKVNHSSHC